MPLQKDNRTDAHGELGMERLSPARRIFKHAIFNPVANYMPAGVLKALLKFSKSQLAAANWKDPGGWKSMAICYEGRCRQIADRVLVNAGIMSMAVRNRKRLGAHLLAELIAECPEKPAHVLCLGAGPGNIILDALERARLRKLEACATLVDVSAEAFEFGLQQAAKRGLDKHVRYIQADVRELHKFLDRPAHVVKMLGICEYLTDEQIVTIAQAACQLMPRWAAIVFNSLNRAHGTDRFFRRVFGLHMNHRSASQVEALMRQAGFADFTVHHEPLGVFDVIVGRKAASV